MKTPVIKNKGFVAVKRILVFAFIALLLTGCEEDLSSKTHAKYEGTITNVDCNKQFNSRIVFDDTTGFNTSNYLCRGLTEGSKSIVIYEKKSLRIKSVQYVKKK